MTQLVPEVPADDDPVVASNVHLPIQTSERIAKECESRSMTTGELFIEALEATYDRLNDLIHPGGTVGGTLFKARGIGSTPKQKASTKQVAYSLLSSDFEVIDRLKAEVSARSRSQLLTAALDAHLQIKEDD
ncbi:hypothetical protein [Rhodococcus opacus]|uniref:hypothetical protein n=1 Tax=Rhodococcus opacus TaxID=37919 RepID=UPI001C481269|nr:hypothetical protein [Rhodococcus opacus]MBV6762655.1 hypothetical protein [Rhodococcus opacus]